jgi:hypothetical protein
LPFLEAAAVSVSAAAAVSVSAAATAAAGRIFVRKISRTPLTGFQQNFTGTLIVQLRSAEREMVDLDLISRSPEVINMFFSCALYLSK